MKYLLHLAAIAALSIGSLTAGTLQYQVAVNTAGLTDLAEIDFELVPAPGLPLVVEAIVGGFTPLASLPGVEGLYLGAPVGSVTGTLSMSNAAGGDSYYAGYTPGNVFQFLLTPTGAGVGAGAGGTVETGFRVILLASNLAPVAGGTVVKILLAGNGTPTVTVNQQIASATLIPEPSTWMMFSGAALLFVRRLKA